MGISVNEARIGRAVEVATFLPEPERRERTFTIVSVDDHLVEPPHTFEGRLPKAVADRAPRVIDGPNGGDVWLYDGHILENVGVNALAGRPQSEWSSDPTRFADMRKGAYDINSRIHDMDLDGVFASVCFPSHLGGFGGARIQTVTSDTELAFATLQAWNDWVSEEWAAAFPSRMIPLGITWLHDPALGAAEVLRNAERGFRALTFPDDPTNYGWPSLYTNHWDPIFRACEETGTVVCIHIGSGGRLPDVPPDAPMDVTSVVVGLDAVNYTVNWLYSKVADRFPELKIAISEGGIGWVAGLLDRLDHTTPRLIEWTGTWKGTKLTPSELLKRNFWFCTMDDPSSMVQLDRIGANHVMFEVDYPHADSSWPNSQSALAVQLEGLDEVRAANVAWRNASELFRFDVPAEVQADPNTF